MLRKILLVGITISLSYITYATEINKSQFNSIIDYLNCEITDAYISNLPLEAENYRKIKDQLEKNTIEDPLSFSELEDLLKDNNFTITFKNLTSVINEKKNIFEELEDNSKPESVVKAIFDQINLNGGYNKIYNQVSGLLKKETLEYLEKEYQVESFGNTNDVSNNNENTEENSKILSLEDRIFQLEHDTWSKFLQFGSFLVIVLILLGCFFYFLKTNYFDSIKSDRNKIAELERLVKNHKRLIDDFDEELTRTDIRISKLESSRINTKSYIDRQPCLQRNDNVKETKLPDVKREIREEFFMSTPNNDGSFNVSSSSVVFKPKASFYKFVLINDHEAKFFFVEDEDSIKTAINYPDLYIENACEPENAIDFNSKKINTVTPGIATKELDKWKISKKAQIRYE